MFLLVNGITSSPDKAAGYHRYKNTIGYYGLFQLAPNYPGYDGDVDAQINGAVYLFNNGGMKHWAL